MYYIVICYFSKQFGDSVKVTRKNGTIEEGISGKYLVRDSENDPIAVVDPNCFGDYIDRIGQPCTVVVVDVVCGEETRAPTSSELNGNLWIPSSQ